jgi:nitrite reductase (NADH) large subunit
MKTSVEGVFAAGDCAEHKGKVYGIWPSAEAQGRVAASNMAGTEATFEGIVPSNTMKVSDVPVFSIGALDGDEIVVLQKEGVFRRFVYDESDRLVGAILIGTLKERQKIVNAITQKQGYEPMEV